MVHVPMQKILESEVQQTVGAYNLGVSWVQYRTDQAPEAGLVMT